MAAGWLSICIYVSKPMSIRLLLAGGMLLAMSEC